MKINAILDILYSNRDRAGNCYYAFRYTRTEDGKQVTGKISGGQSNILAAIGELHPGNDYYWTQHGMGWREWSNATAGWQYAGCPPEAIAKFIREGLAA